MTSSLVGSEFNSLEVLHSVNRPPKHASLPCFMVDQTHPQKQPGLEQKGIDCLTILNGYKSRQVWRHPLMVCVIWLQVISATPDGKEFDKEDAELQLDQGTPRCIHYYCCIYADNLGPCFSTI